MKSNKRFSNVTFTKRVDHDGGRKRAERSFPEGAVCETCGAVRSGRRWVAGARVGEANAERVWHPDRYATCPACSRKRENLPRGVVTLGGTFLNGHLREVENLIGNEAERAAEDNPTARIMDWTGGRGGEMVVTTTTGHLAQRLGHALEKAFGGEVNYTFSHENELTRVAWRRD